MNMNNQMEESEASILHTYNRFPVVLSAEKVYIFMTLKALSIWILQPESL